ncbi:MAG TPA: ABC transporter substrate-binding protein [Candidatus Desulfovibrio intestinavium]|uniref:ABC transporter substrate-binding protein n=1 Tax=Candidatus Desulfovibrio intestinavium TaxID=2838534 RepID=A0A9D2KRS4_9BACT|nr:ABC transporter substrate-binding protein [Candidatus Desulfovibrio intestinavium]
MKQVFFWAVLCLLLATTAQAAPVTVKSAWLDEYEALPAWYAHERQWDAEAGISLDMRIYPSGKFLMDNMSSIKWDVAGLGGAPAVPGMLRKQAIVVGIGSDEAAANAVYVRPDSPLLTAFQQKLSARDYARLVTGKVVLCPRGTSAHQLLLLWLDRMGLSEESISLMDTPPAESVGNLSGGVGDMAVLWSPETWAAEQAGLKALLTGKDLGLVQPTLLMARCDYAEKNPDGVRAFLACYLRAVEALRAMPAEELGALYRQFQKEFCGKDISAEQAARDVASHTLYPLDRQREVLASEGELLTWLGDVIAFHERTGELSRGQTRAIRELSLVRADFLPASLPESHASDGQ